MKNLFMVNSSQPPAKPLVLAILDGWGVSAPSPANAISLAKKPNLDSYYASFPSTVLQAAGEAVGLPHGEAGNSEVGHLNLGAGRIVYQELPRINMAIADGSFLKNKMFREAVDHVKKNRSSLHIMGLVGSGGVHSSIEHLYALLWLMKQNEIVQVYLHLFTDGRDSPPSSALQFFKELGDKLNEIEIGQIVTVSGRYYAMDRDNRWERTERAYKAITEGIGAKARSTNEAIDQSYKKNATDEFIEPTVIYGDEIKPKFVKENDAIIFFNFRPDRARQLTQAFLQENFNSFPRNKLKNILFVSMTEYLKGLPIHVAFPTPKIDFPLSLVFSTNNIRQLHISETEKYAHVTYFFNGGVEHPSPLEDRIHIPSPKVATYDLKPEMSAYFITEEVSKRLRNRAHDFYVINFANADMVAHTGSLEATVKAVEVVDYCLGRIVADTYPMGGAVIVTADHGNAEQMINPVTRGVDTEHNSNPVPFLIIQDKLRGKGQKLQSGILADVAPTILNAMGLQQPNEMTGRDLLA